MNSLTIVVAQSDCVIAEHLAANLHTHFRDVIVARDIDDLLHAVMRRHPDLVILDLEFADPDEFKKVMREMRSIGVICTHRVPDEDMWRASLDAGALDCCCCDYIQTIVRVARRWPMTLHATAA